MTSRVRKGQAPPHLSRDEFRRRYLAAFDDPRFDGERDAIARLEAIAYRSYEDGRKAPRTERAGDAGEGFVDSSYDLSVDWLRARAKIAAAKRKHDDRSEASCVLVVCASDRNDGTCPGEASKSFRLATIASDALRAQGVEPDLLDLSLVSSEYGRHIHPCKGCVSTAMPLCHWPCSCYPNHSLGQINDWMEEIYERFTRAHGVMVVTPVYWYQAPGTLKAMMDRLVCADGGNPDPTSTQGKDAAKAKALESAGWPFPQHLAGRAYGLVVHGDAAGGDLARRALSDFFDDMGLVRAGAQGQIDRYIGYYEPYATSHDALDRDEGVQEETRVVARALANAVKALRRGALVSPDDGLARPRPK